MLLKKHVWSFCMGSLGQMLVLVCSSTYLLVMHVTIQEISTFRFGTRYILICTSNKAVQIQMYLVPNQNVDFSWIDPCITRRYVQLSNSYSPVQVVSYDTWVCAIAALCHTKYAQSLYSEEDRVAGLQRQSLGMPWHNPVLSTYWVRNSMYWVRTEYVRTQYRAAQPLLGRQSVQAWTPLQGVFCNQELDVCTSMHTVTEPRWKCCVKCKMKGSHLKLTQRMP